MPTIGAKGLARTRELQSLGVEPWSARCQAAGELGCPIGTINTAKAEERKRLTAERDLCWKQEYESRHGAPKVTVISGQISLFGPGFKLPH